MLCIYCHEHEADAREHFLPQCLGRFENFEPLLDRLCETCNTEIGAKLEREFCRRSPEAVLRSMHWIKPQRRRGRNKRQAHIYQPEKIGGPHIYFFGPDPDSGRHVLWQTGKQPRTVNEISQVVILDDDDNAVEHIPIPVEITTGRELVEILFKKRNATFIKRALVIVASGDETRVQALFSDINVPVPMERRKGGRIPQQFFMAQLSPAYFRALAKIGFHYALRYIPTLTGNEGAFRPLREFIRHGIGNADQFLCLCDAIPKHAGPIGHCLTAVANPNSDIFVNMQFFVGSRTPLAQWRLTLGSNPTVLFVSQSSAHFFPYIEDVGGGSQGGKVVTLSAVFHKG